MQQTTSTFSPSLPLVDDTSSTTPVLPIYLGPETLNTRRPRDSNIQKPELSLYGGPGIPSYGRPRAFVIHIRKAAGATRLLLLLLISSVHDDLLWFVHGNLFEWVRRNEKNHRTDNGRNRDERLSLDLGLCWGICRWCRPRIHRCIYAARIRYPVCR